jgi:predicted Zn-dependent protease
MLKKSFLRFLVALLILLLGICASAQVAQPPFPDFQPPEPRIKAKTPFAPKPTTGNNIFKGEAEGWLTNSILSIEQGNIPAVTDEQLVGYITKLGDNLVKYSAKPERTYTFTIVDSEEEDAFCVGSGRVYINLGILREVANEDELAGILAHEIAHDQFGHVPKTVTRQLFWMKGTTKVRSQDESDQALKKLLAAYEKNAFASAGELLLGWSRNDELQADKAGFYTIYKAGYNPEAMKNVFRHYAGEEKRQGVSPLLTLLFGTHPPSGQRVTALKWESLWIKMPPKDEFRVSAAFNAMKERLSKH